MTSVVPRVRHLEKGTGEFTLSATTRIATSDALSSAAQLLQAHRRVAPA